MPPPSSGARGATMWIAIRSFGTVGEFSTASEASLIDSEPRSAVALSETATLPVHSAFPRLYRS